MCPLAAEPGESILPRSPAPSGQRLLQDRGSPVGAGCFSCTDLWGAEAALSLGKNWEVEKNPKPKSDKQKKNAWGDYFLQSPVVVEDETGWNNFSELGRPHVAPRCCWILLLDTGVPMN